MKGRKLVTSEESVRTSRQHKKPCKDCPWTRTSLKGWLGGSTVEEWLQAVHGETLIKCHVCSNQQCAGAAIYRRNVCKILADERLLVLEKDTETVFANPMQFKEHHDRKRV